MAGLEDLPDDYLIASLPPSIKPEVASRLKSAAEWKKSSDILGERLIATEKRLEQCEALNKYAQHRPNCQFLASMIGERAPAPCTCGYEAARAALDDRPCTCHPDDNPPRPCPKKYAYSECVDAARAALEE